MSKENRFVKAEMQLAMEVARLTKSLQEMKQDAKRVLSELDKQVVDKEYKHKLENFILITDTILKNPLELEHKVETLNKMVLEGLVLLEKFDLPTKK